MVWPLCARLCGSVRTAAGASQQRNVWGVHHRLASGPHDWAMGLAEFFETVLLSSGYFATTGGVEMEEREAALKDASELLRGLLAKPGAEAPALDLQVKAGGRQAQYAPVPWIRLYDSRYSPRTTEGLYLVYLFAGDGSRLYLSLNQGTSEYRSGKMRPISEAARIRSEALAARARLDGIDVPIVARSGDEIDLAVDALPVGRESKQRARNYELGNILAIEYLVAELPGDVELLADLRSYVDLLAVVCGFGADAALKDKSLGPDVPLGQRYVVDPALRRAIEVEAMNRATELYAAEGWEVTDVSRHQSFDLLCTMDGVEKHVEVKGTTTPGRSVFLTEGEVRHAQAFPNVGLVIVSNLKVATVNGLPSVTGGKAARIDPWVLHASALTPTQYSYRHSSISSDEVNGAASSAPVGMGGHSS